MAEPAVQPECPGRGGPLVEVRGVSLGFGGDTVLSNVDLAIAPGEIVTLIGPNGAGKTTLVRVVLGLLAPGAGTVIARPGLTVGYVPQRLQVDPVLPLSARRLLDLPRPHPDERVLAVLAEVGAEALAERQVRALSGGELQRLLLARALLRDPDLLVLDEPLQGVDLAGQIALFDLIAAVRDRRGCGVLMVSHDLHVVMAGTDRVVCLNRHICCSGHPETVTRHPEYLALFGRRAAESLAIYSHDHDHAHDLDGTVVELPGEPPQEPAAPDRKAARGGA
jgi:zinc transport system ATP-binding protein